MYYSDDPERDYDRYDRDMTEWLNSLPVCEHCGQPIQEEEWYEIDGAEIHEDCLSDYCKEHFRKNSY